MRTRKRSEPSRRPLLSKSPSAHLQNLFLREMIVMHPNGPFGQSPAYNNGHGREHGFSERSYVAEHLVGYRTWTYERDGMFLLHGLTITDYIWRPGINAAECFRKKDYSTELGRIHQTEQVPVPECGCGFWAYGSIENVPTFYRGGHKVVGAIYGWGKLRIGDRGFRAQYAKIVALHIPESKIVPRGLRAQYPGVKYYDSFDELASEFPASNTKTLLD